MFRKLCIVLPVIFLIALNAPDLYGQQSVDTLTTLENSPRHQIGFPATSTFRFLTRSDDQVYELRYRYRYRSGAHQRVSLSFKYSSADAERLDVDARFGLDRVFTRSANSRWKFYSGADFALGIEKQLTGDNWYYSAGVIPFIGALYRIDEHFSVSTEPGILLQVRHINDTSDFGTPDDETWVEMEMVDIGQITLSFHF